MSDTFKYFYFTMLLLQCQTNPVVVAKYIFFVANLSESPVPIFVKVCCTDNSQGYSCFFINYIPFINTGINLWKNCAPTALGQPAMSIKAGAVIGAFPLRKVRPLRDMREGFD